MLALETYQWLSLGTLEASLSLNTGQEDSSLGKARALSAQGSDTQVPQPPVQWKISKPKGMALEVMALGIVVSSHREPMACITKAARLSALLALPASPFLSPLPQPGYAGNSGKCCLSTQVMNKGGRTRDA